MPLSTEELEILYTWARRVGPDDRRYQHVTDVRFATHFEAMEYIHRAMETPEVSGWLLHLRHYRKRDGTFTRFRLLCNRL